MTESNLALIRELLHRLQDCPERSGEERLTRQILRDFLSTHTTMELHTCGNGFYAAHREGDGPGLALRADYDAVPLPDGSAAHLCGHDGHAAALCAAALETEGKQFGHSIFFLFQPAEEIGAGAESCLELFRRERVAEIYGAHNLPGFRHGQVFTRKGTFACASRGLILHLNGTPAHAAYPEYGISPAPVLGKLLCELPELAAPERYRGMTLCTVIGSRLGERSFGVAASEAELWLTLRAEQDDDLAALRESVLSRTQSLAAQARLRYSYEEQDIFPATANHPQAVEKLRTFCNAAPLEVPMRWSEDFGHYLKAVPGAFFGIGAGEDCPPLHTEGYRYPESLLEPAAEAFLSLIQAPL